MDGTDKRGPGEVPMPAETGPPVVATRRAVSVVFLDSDRAGREVGGEELAGRGTVREGWLAGLEEGQ
jgi:hypothetical protein